MRNIKPVQWGHDQYINLDGIYKPINDLYGVWVFTPSILYDGISFYPEDLDYHLKHIYYRIKRDIGKDYEKHKNR